jgi:hypothetical protein
LQSVFNTKDQKKGGHTTLEAKIKKDGTSQITGAMTSSTADFGTFGHNPNKGLAKTGLRRTFMAVWSLADGLKPTDTVIEAALKPYWHEECEAEAKTWPIQDGSVVGNGGGGGGGGGSGGGGGGGGGEFGGRITQLETEKEAKKASWDQVGATGTDTEGQLGKYESIGKEIRAIKANLELLKQMQLARQQPAGASARTQQRASDRAPLPPRTISQYDGMDDDAISSAISDHETKLEGLFSEQEQENSRKRKRGESEGGLLSSTDGADDGDTQALRNRQKFAIAVCGTCKNVTAIARALVPQIPCPPRPRVLVPVPQNWQWSNGGCQFLRST